MPESKLLADWLLELAMDGKAVSKEARAAAMQLSNEVWAKFRERKFPPVKTP